MSEARIVYSMILMMLVGENTHFYVGVLLNVYIQRNIKDTQSIDSEEERVPVQFSKR